MAFVFSLASLLGVRRRREKAEERSLRQVSSELDEARQLLERINSELVRLAEERNAEPPRTRLATELHERYARFSNFQQCQAEMLARIAHLRDSLAAQQKQYLLARRDRELLEELETAQRGTYVAGLERQERKRNDDAFLSRYLRH